MKTNIMRSALVALLPLALSATDTLRAQTKPVATQTVTADKAEADQQVFRQLAAYSGGQLIVPPLTVPDSLLSPTREEGVMLLRGHRSKSTRCVRMFSSTPLHASPSSASASPWRAPSTC